MEEGTWKRQMILDQPTIFGFIALGHDHWESSMISQYFMYYDILKISDAAHISSSLEMIMKSTHYSYVIITSTEYHPKERSGMISCQF